MKNWQYLIDANVLIGAMNEYYGFDFCPAFWEWLLLSHAQGKTASVQEVADELLEKKDALSSWVKENPGFFQSHDDDVVAARMKVEEAVENDAGYNQMSKDAFLAKGEADPWLIARAMAKVCTVVTFESRRRRKQQIKIPTLCQKLGVKYCSPFKMLSAEKPRFILEHK